MKSPGISSGFTLVEILIASALISILFLSFGIFDLQFIERFSRRLDEALEKEDELLAESLSMANIIPHYAH